MKKINKIFLFFTTIIFLNSCGGLSDAGKVLRNEKVRSSDEFLVKKREPLSLPPDYKELPEPNSMKNIKEKKEDNINKIFNIPKEEASQNKGALSVEQSIIDKIRKWKIVK